MIRMRPSAPMPYGFSSEALAASHRVAFTILDSMPVRQLLLYAADLPGTWPLLPLDPAPHREREWVAMVMDGIGEGLGALHG